MGLHPPTLWSMQTGTGYALQFSAPHSFAKFLLRQAGECYVKPILTKPTTTFSTTSSSNVAAGQGQVMAVASAANIAVGSVLTIADSNQESVLVTAVSGLNITADFAFAHNGTSNAFTVSGVAFNAAPTQSPAASAGAPRSGWFHLSTLGESYSLGVEAGPSAGTPSFPGGAADLIYGCLIWCITGTAELAIMAH